MMGGPIGEIDVAEQNPSLRLADEATESIDEARFAGAVRSNQSNDLAWPNGKRDVIDCRNTSKSNREVGDHQRIGRRGPLRCIGGFRLRHVSDRLVFSSLCRGLARFQTMLAIGDGSI